MMTDAEFEVSGAAARTRGAVHARWAGLRPRPEAVAVTIGGDGSRLAADDLLWARDRGVRAVRVPGRLGKPAARSLRHAGVAVSLRCSAAAGFVGAGILPEVSRALAGSGADELEVPVEAGAVAEGGPAAAPLRPVAAVCHAHGALAGFSVAASGATAARIRAVVRLAAAASADYVAIDAPAGFVDPGTATVLAAAAVDESRGRIGVRVTRGRADAVEVGRLLEIGVEAVGLDAVCARGLLDGPAGADWEPSPAADGATRRALRPAA